MPIYEYRCCHCGKITEKISKKMASAIDCPNCGCKADKIVSVFSGKNESASDTLNSCRPGSGFS